MRPGSRSLRPVPPRAAFSLSEALLALAILAMSMGPILLLSSHNVQAVGVDRVRLLCEALCRNTLERFGSLEDDVWESLRSTPDPRVREGIDPWLTDRTMRTSLAGLEFDRLAKVHEIHGILTVERDVRPGLGRVTCQVVWKVQGGAAGRVDSITYSRLFVTAGVL